MSDNNEQQINDVQENSIPEEVKVKSFIQHISDLINDRKKNNHWYRRFDLRCE